MRVLNDICNMVEDELEDITRSGKLNPDTLEIIGESVDIIKDVETVKAMRGSSYEGGSSYERGRISENGRSNAMYYDDGYSMTRGGNGDGRSNRDGYSRHDEKEMLKEKLDELKYQLNQMR